MKITDAQDDLTDLAVKTLITAKLLVQTTPEITPIIVMKKGNISAIGEVGELFGSLKHMKRRGLQQIIREFEAESFALASEAWSVLCSIEEMSDPNRRPAREHEDRQEILIITAENRKQDWVFISYEIIRHEDGSRTLSDKPIKVQVGNGWEDGTHQGGLVNLFEEV